MTGLIFYPHERLAGCPSTRMNDNRFDFLPARTIIGLPLHPPERITDSISPPARTIKGLPLHLPKRITDLISLLARTINGLPLHSDVRITDLIFNPPQRYPI